MFHLFLRNFIRFCIWTQKILGLSCHLCRIKLLQSIWIGWFGEKREGKKRKYLLSNYLFRELNEREMERKELYLKACLNFFKIGKMCNAVNNNFFLLPFLWEMLSVFMDGYEFRDDCKIEYHQHHFICFFAPLTVTTWCCTY